MTTTDTESDVSDPKRSPEIDFSVPIERLQTRARASRWRVKLLTYSLSSLIFCVVVFLLGSLTLQNTRVLGTGFDLVGDSQYNDPFYKHIANLARDLSEDGSNVGHTTDEQQRNLADQERELDNAIARFERMRAILSGSANLGGSDRSLVPILATGVFSLGVITIIVLIITIFISFIRYHSQLAELYETQADALKASNGSPDLAYKFVEKFSPSSIAMGKVPPTVYEKALDTVKEALSQRAK